MAAGASYADARSWPYVGALGPGHVLGIGDDGRLVGNYWVPSVRLDSWNFTGGAQG